MNVRKRPTRSILALAVIAAAAALNASSATHATSPTIEAATPNAELAGRSHILLTKRMRIVLAYRSVVPA
jgi:hypothetical protein